MDKINSLVNLTLNLKLFCIKKNKKGKKIKRKIHVEAYHNQVASIRVIHPL
jgi:hypothetical protein